MTQTPESCARFAALCATLVRLGGWNIHLFTAVLHPNYQWVHPLHSHLRQRFLGHRYWPGWDDLLSDDQTFYMSDSAYARCWQPSTLKPANEFGRALWLGVAWPRTP